MATFLRPGVYVEETLNPVQPTAGPSSNAYAAFVGGSDRGPVVPTLITSWSQYVSTYGSWNTSASLPATNNLPLAVYMFFQNGGRQAYVLRVVTTADASPSNNAASATRTLTDSAGSPNNTLTLTAKNPGTWGNAVNVTVTASSISGYFNLNVYYNGTGSANIVERFTDMTMTASDARYAIAVINAGSTFLTAVDANSPSTGATKNPPTTVVNTALTTGLNGLAVTGTVVQTALVTNGTSLLDTIPQSLILNVPNFTDSSTVNAALAYAEYRTDVFVVIDGLDDTAANEISAAAAYTASSYGAVYYPQLVISDPTLGLGAARGATKKVAPGGAVVGQFASTDAANGVFKAPAGLQTRIAGAVSVPSLTNTELDNLNTAAKPVNAIKYVPGAGIVIMGARTLKATYVDRYVPVRRTLIYLSKSLKDLAQFAVFEPNDAALWRRIDSTLSSFLTDFWAQGGLTGATPAQAYYVKVDSENNTPTTIDNGEVRIEVGVALQRPAEYLIIKIGQFNGETTVTVA